MIALAPDCEFCEQVPRMPAPPSPGAAAKGSTSPDFGWASLRRRQPLGPFG
jgi:hypothetical protein